MKNAQLEIPALDTISSQLDKIEKSLEKIHKEKPCIEKWLNTKQVAKLLGLTERTLQTYRDRGDIPFSQYGRVIRYRPEDIQEFLMSHYVKLKNGGHSDE